MGFFEGGFDERDGKLVRAISQFISKGKRNELAIKIRFILIENYNCIHGCFLVTKHLLHFTIYLCNTDSNEINSFYLSGSNISKACLLSNVFYCTLKIKNRAKECTQMNCFAIWFYFVGLIAWRRTFLQNLKFSPIHFLWWFLSINLNDHRKYLDHAISTLSTWFLSVKCFRSRFMGVGQLW